MWKCTISANSAQKMKFSIKDFFSKCDQIRRKLRILSHLLKKSLMENFIFWAIGVETVPLMWNYPHQKISWNFRILHSVNYSVQDCKPIQNFLNHPKLCGNCAFQPNFHTRKLGEILVFYAVVLHSPKKNFNKSLTKIPCYIDGQRLE